MTGALHELADQPHDSHHAIERNPRPSPASVFATSPRYRKSRAAASTNVWRHADTAPKENLPEKDLAHPARPAASGGNASATGPPGRRPRRNAAAVAIAA